MGEIKQAQHITPIQVAKKLGNEMEYVQALQEQELKMNFDAIMDENIESIEKNNYIINGN